MTHFYSKRSVALAMAAMTSLWMMAGDLVTIQGYQYDLDNASHEAMTPPEYPESLVDDPSMITLMVPAAAKQAYQTAEGWQDFNFGEVTGIHATAKEDTDANGSAYSLGGVRISAAHALPHGLYIKNGKKFVNK